MVSTRSFSPQCNAPSVHRSLLRIVAFAVVVLMVPQPASARDLPRPVVERIMPRSGPPGTEVVVVGRGLTPVQTFRLGSQEMTVRSRTANRVVLVVPEGARSGAITLVTPFGEFDAPTFRVTAAPPPPAIAEVQPAVAEPGEDVRLIGRHFGRRATDNRVVLGGQSVLVRRATPTELVVRVPDGAQSGAFSVRVGAQSAESPAFTVRQPLSLTGTTPQVLPPRGSLRIQGTGFGEDRRAVTVTLDGRRLRVRSVSPTEIEVQAARIRTDRLRLPLVVAIAPRGQPRREATVEVATQGPSITSITPPVAYPGSTLVLAGSGFGGDAPLTVRAGTTALTVVERTAEQLRVRMPSTRPTPAPETLTVQVGTLPEATRPLAWLPALQVARPVPQAAAVGAEVQVQGQGFSDQADVCQVQVAGTAQEMVRASAEALVFRVGDGRSGALTVHCAGAVASARQPLTVLRAVQIQEMVPARGMPGDEIVLRGEGFGVRPRLVNVRLGRRPMEVVSVTDDTLRVRIPEGARDGNVSVRVGVGQTVETAEPLVIRPMPRVFALAPEEAYPGVELRIQGERFAREGITARFEGVRRPVEVRRLSPVELRVVVPRRAQTGTVALLMPEGTIEAGTLTIVAAPTGVAVTEVAPTCVNPTCQVTLRGHGFSANARRNRVRFDGVAVEVVSATVNELTVRLPDHPANARFEVRVGRHRAESPPFVLQQMDEVSANPR